MRTQCTSYQGSKTIINTHAPKVIGRHSKRTDNPRRVNRRDELDDYHVLAAVPEGSARADILTDVWIPAIAEHPALAFSRRDRRRNVLKVAEALLQRCEYESRTSTPGKQWLMDVTGLSRATVRLCLFLLRAMGFLGLVAGGRRAEYTPRSSDAYARWGDGYSPVADRSVYVLCMPLTAEEEARRLRELAARMADKCKLNLLLARFSAAVDLSKPPIQPNPEELNPKAIKAWASPTLKGYFQALSERGGRLSDDRRPIHWPVTQTTSAIDEATTRHNELQAARTLQFEVPALRPLSARYVARLAARWFRADWTVRDIKHALDTLPDGRPRPHDAFTGARNIGAMFHHKMNDWCVAGVPGYSQTQRTWFASEEGRERAYTVAKAKREAPTPPPADDSQFARGVKFLRDSLKARTKLSCDLRDSVI